MGLSGWGFCDSLNVLPVLSLSRVLRVEALLPEANSVPLTTLLSFTGVQITVQIVLLLRQLREWLGLVAWWVFP